MKHSYLQAVLDKIEDNNAKEAIAEELASHLFDKRDYYVELGYDEAEAMRKAEKDMGEPDDTAVPLNALHPNSTHKTFMVVSLLFELLFLAAGIWFSNVFCYGSEHLLAIFHSIGIDLLSFGFTVGFAVILMLARKWKKKSVATSVIVTLALYFLISLLNSGTQSLCGLFQPAVYAIFTLITKGFNGYIDRIFAYQYTPWDEKTVFVTGAVIIFAVLLLWAAVVLTVIYRQERLHNTRVLQRILKGVQAAVSVLLCANLLLMATGTVAAAINLPNKRATALKERKRLINFVICADSNTFYEEIAKRNYQIYSAKDNTNLSAQQFYDTDTLTNNTLLAPTTQNDAYQINDLFGFTITNYSSDLPLLSHDIRITAKEREQLDNLYTLDDFIKLGWYTKAVMVTNNQTNLLFISDSNNTHKAVIRFLFLTEDGNTREYAFEKINETYCYVMHFDQLDSIDDGTSSNFKYIQ